ncbi:hypothetical protein SLS62_001889 [Diatrype stigma]|uniref:RanBD1 domain-containing protein n=1 Tax=Diatrype stigma TaxID=117547 RepID=A0AAN9UZE7_9PEZI
MNFNATPRKRPAPGEPGSTPFSSSKFQSSLVPMGRPTPSRSYHPPKNKNKPTGFSSNTRDIFRTSTPQANRVSTFSPDLPPAVTKATPSARKFVPQKTIGAGMSSAASADLFKMRIPSPDPELTGEVLAKQVPDDPNRTGTIYTDQYLAHKCPPHFDELQRRQFFCILDLRRLKYAANEIFVKKDWKLNILNFAKEYEKSRGLILLRYGLYEFKKVKPSAEVLKRWRAAHGLPEHESEDKESVSSSANLNGLSASTATKRKADGDLEPKDNALTASTANQNKRRNVDQEMASPIPAGPAPFKKSKRKVEETDEPDENQPSKQQKQENSTAKSTFESILDKAQNTPSPLKRAPLGAAAQSTPFGTPKASAFQSTDSAAKPNNPFATPSVSQPSTSLFGSKPTNGNGPQKHESVLAAHKPGSTLPANTGMFGYLSGSSANTSGNEKEDADDDDAESESGSEPGAESQDAAPSYEPSAAASTGTSTPPAQNGTSLFSSSKPGGTGAPLGGLFNKPADTAAKGGLFDRVKLGADGQPIRATPDLDEKKTPVPEVSTPSTPAVETSKTPAKTPGDFRFDPTTTPISFSQPSTTPATAKPSLFSADPVSDTPKGLPKTEDVPATKPSSIFGTATQASSTSGTVTPKPLFGQTGSASNIFQPKPSESTSSIFGAPKSFEVKPTDATKQPSVSPTKSSFGDIFGKKTEPTTSAPPEQPKSLFSTAFSGTPSAVAPSTSNTGLFGKPAESQGTGPKDQQQNLFNTPSASATPKVVFEKQTESKPPGVQDVPKGLFGASITPSSTPSGGQDAPRPTGLFGASVTPSSTPLFQPSKRGFGDAQKSNEHEAGEPSAKKPASTSVFGANSAAGSFGGWGSTNTQSSDIPSPAMQSPAKSIFNGFRPETPNGTSDPTQGAKGIFSTTPANSFPAPTTPKPAFTPSFSFGANQPAPTEQPQNGSMNMSNVFGNSTATSGPSFEFKAPSPAPSSPAPLPGRRIATPKRRLGPSGAGSQTPNTSFNSGVAASQPQPSTGFSFGSNGSGPASVASSFEKENSNGGFNFTFGGNGQSVSNPFNPSNGQASTPMFGNNGSTPSASASFGATPTQSMVFGGMANGTNGAPSINFQAPTPQQNTSNIFAPKNTGLFGNNLQPSGDGTMGASTTPVNGTPEPQTQGQDGEEAPQEQISLTAGGPGEEDEDILHEVRAKAIKYIPVTKDDEGEKTKSPWHTQGIGPLRILKNKTTGSVRLLLRAEPRGHVAMNKAILPDVDYKAKDKTINFVAASDDGAGLETWVLQVKKPEFAQELASAMEANKAANKK